MALTQVRAKLGEEWVSLTYNEATGRYELQTTAPGTSFYQPGGYYNVEVDATNESGAETEISGTQLASLRWEVNEKTSPTLTLISPAPGYLQTQTPTFVFEATDEEGGSGVDPESFTPEGAAAEPITGGYRFTWSPPEPWNDGAHTVTATVSDNDGNVATVSGAYTVDTVPPEIILRKPYRRHIVDDESVEVVLDAWDAVSGVASVTIGGTPVGGGVLTAPSQRADGDIGPYVRDVPLTVGENHIPVTVTDGAGNVTTAEVYMIRLVTDRGEADLEAIRTLCKKPVETWTEAEQSTWAAAVKRGSWDAETLNRVGVATQWLAGELVRRGYIASVTPKTDWTKKDAQKQSQMTTYLRDVETVRSAQNLYVQEIPGTLRFSDYQDWNNIEKALVETDAIFPNYFAWTSGEVTCGGV